jgi:hypothetical protein
MPSWKKVIVSGSQAHLQGITASNLTNNTNTPTGQIVGYNPTTGILSYFNTSSIIVATASYALTASFINPIGTNAFVQNGNSFGATAVLGTNDNHSLIFETNGAQKAIIAPSGYTKFNYATNDGTQAFGVVNTSIAQQYALSGYNIWSGSNDVNDVVTGQFVFTGDNYNNDNIRQTLILGQPALGGTRPNRIAIMANTTQEPYDIGFDSASIDFIIGSKNTGRILQIKSGSVGIGMGATELTDNTIRLRLRGSGTTSTTTALRVENSSAAARLTILDDGTSAFNTNHLYVSGSGLVGIGTNLPTAELHISGASTDSLLRVGSPTQANALFVTGSGRVGIGTSTPTNTLQVSGSLWATTITASNIPSASNANFLLYNSQSGEFTYLSTSSIGGNVQGTGANTQITYWTGTNTIAGNAGLTYDAGTSTVTVGGDLAVNGGDITTTSANATIFNSNATTLSIGSGANSVNIGAGTGITNVKNNLVVAGDLTVNGDTTIINTTNLSIEDKFIVLGRTSGSQIPASEGGIIVEGAAGSGSAFVFNSGSGAANGLANRWGVALGVGTASINVTPIDFMVTVSSSGVSPTDSNPPTFGSASFGYGNMHINTTDGEIWIYS